MDEAEIRAFPPKGVILSGGPESVTAERRAARAASWSSNWACRCSASATACRPWPQQLGGKVEAAGPARISAMPRCAPTATRSLLRGHRGPHQPRRLRPAGCVDEPRRPGDRAARRLRASSPAPTSAPIAGMADEERRFYGVQFHPEVTHTRQGRAHPAALRARHLRLRGPVDRRQHHRRQHRARSAPRSADDEVLLGLSGGVDSSVVAALLHRAIGEQLTCVFVDNGLLRLHEGDQVMATFAEHMGVRVIRVDAEERFLARAGRRRAIRSASARSSAHLSSRSSRKRRPS